MHMLLQSACFLFAKYLFSFSLFMYALNMVIQKFVFIAPSIPFHEEGRGS